MTYSGVGKVVPSMAAPNTNASSQNATRRRVARLPSSAASASSNEPSQSEWGIRPGARGAAVVIGRSWRGSVMVVLM